MTDGRQAGRPAQFRPDEVIRSAMVLFWERGYAATSLEDLESRTGLARSSLYNAFGSKHGIYLRSLSTYIELLGELMFAPLENGTRGLEDVHDFFERLRKGLARGLQVSAAARGCMLVNGMMESGGGDAELALLNEAFSTRFLSSMSAALERAESRGEIASGGVGRRARLLLAIALGVNVSSRAGASRGEIALLVDAAQDLLKTWRLESAEGAKSP